MSTGDTEMPFARAEVMTLLASQNASFKISSTKEWMGAITQDRTTAIHGVLGRKAALLPVVSASSAAAESRGPGTTTGDVHDRRSRPCCCNGGLFLHRRH